MPAAIVLLAALGGCTPEFRGQAIDLQKLELMSVGVVKELDAAKGRAGPLPVLPPAAREQIALTLGQEEARKGLTDPETARFSGVHLERRRGQAEAVYTVCGTVDARNPLGSFVGPQRFVSLMAVSPAGSAYGVASFDRPAVGRYCQAG